MPRQIKNIYELKTVPTDLSELSNVVEKTVHDKLVNKVNAIDTIGFVSKTQYNTDKLDLEKEIDDVDKTIPDTSALTSDTSVSNI